jgi:hypothetical protein
MRTTLEIDDDVMEAAKQVARLKDQGLGKTISELARRGLVPESMPSVEMQGGIPVWIHQPGAIPITSEMVRNLADDE